MSSLKTLLSVVALFSYTLVTAQNIATKCIDPAIEGQAENIKRTYEKQGLVIFQESMLAMTSMEPSPIAIRLQAGIQYQFIFVGSSQSNRLTMELFDGADKKLDERVEKDGDHILYTFRPAKTEIYLITLFQKKGMKDMCGYFGVMTDKLKNAAPKVAPVKNTQPTTLPKTTPIKKQPAVSTTPKSTPKKTTTTIISPPPPPPPPVTETKTTTVPDNQRPNPNRTRATQEHQKQQEQEKQ